MELDLIQERINLITMAYGDHSLNFNSVDYIDELPLSVLRTLEKLDLIRLRRQVLDSYIPSKYTFQIKTQAQVVEKIDKVLKSK